MKDFVYLASASPRRLELLTQLGIACRVLPADVDEARKPGESPARYVLRLAQEKAAASRQQLGDVAEAVIGADTSVVLGASILGKPRDAEHAQAMLASLSGRTHDVITGVAVLSEGRSEQVLSRSQLRFRRISPAEARAYWASGEPADKAGGYAIQGLGAVFVESLQGSYSGVVGLPLFETAALLKSCGYALLDGGADTERG